MRRKFMTLAPLLIVFTLAGCTGPVSPDELGTDRPTVSPPANDLVSVAGTTWGEKPSMTFNSDGTYVGNAGCNGISGDWEQHGDTVTFGPMARTDMLCVESTDWAVAPATATFTDASLMIFDVDGAVLDELTAQN